MTNNSTITTRVRDNSICWNLTMRCNDKCSFCFVNLNSCSECSIAENKKFVNLLSRDYGINKINFTGGEALLYKDIFELAEYIKKDNSFKLSLVSNAIILDNARLDKIMNIFDYISFSLDACSDEEEAKVGRNNRHFTRIISVLDKIKAKGGFTVKINSMVSSVNAPYIHELYDRVIAQYDFIDRWKIFRFAPLRGEGQKNGDRYSLTDSLWLQVIDNIGKVAKNSNDKRVEFTGAEIDDYMILDPDGTLKTSNFEKDEIIDNLKRRVA